MEKESKIGTLNKTDWKKIGKGLLIALGGTALTYITDLVSWIEWGEWKPLVVAASSIFINFGWKWLRGQK